MVWNLLRRVFSSHTKSTRPKHRLSVEQLEVREVPAIAFALTDANTLLRFDTNTPGTVSTVNITGLTTGDELVGIDFRPRTGQLYASGVNGTVIRSYTINPSSGVATALSTTATAAQVADVAGGYDFNPTVDRLRYVNQNNENLRLNPNNGALSGDDTNLTFTTPATGPIIAEAYDRNFDRQNNAGDVDTLPTTLFGIDRSTSRLVLQGGIDGTPSPNGGAITSVGVLGITLNAVNDGGFDIVSSTANGGRGTAFAALTANDNVTRLYTLNLTTGAASAVGAIGGGGTEILSLAVVPESVLVIGSGPGAVADVRRLAPAGGAIRAGVPNPFAGFVGGVRVAVGDVNRDGIPDSIVTAIAPQGHVKVFDGSSGAQLPGFIGSFFAFPGFGGNVNISSGDVNRDGFSDVLVVANNAQGHVRAFSGKDGSELASFLAYNGFQGGVTIASADFNLDGTAEIATAAAANGHVKVFNRDGTPFTSAALPSFVNSFIVFAGYLGSVSLATGDVNGDGTADLVVSSGPGTATNVQVRSGQNSFSLLSSFLVTSFGAGYAGGGNVTVGDANNDGRYDVLVAPNAGAIANVFAFDFAGSPIGSSYPAFAFYAGGVSLAGKRF